jgi:MinD-like ATPase involved in chromosome partitioning or flagellar assembly
MPGGDERGHDVNDEWVGLLSDDGRWRWDGEQWQPVEAAPPPSEELPAEEQPGAWPTPWGDLSRDPAHESRPPDESTPPITRASLFGRRHATSEPPEDQRGDSEAEPRPSVEEPATPRDPNAPVPPGAWPGDSVPPGAPDPNDTELGEGNDDPNARPNASMSPWDQAETGEENAPAETGGALPGERPRATPPWEERAHEGPGDAGAPRAGESIAARESPSAPPGPGSRRGEIVSGDEDERREPGAPAGPSRPMRGPAPFGRKSLEPPLIEPVVTGHPGLPTSPPAAGMPPGPRPGSEEASAPLPPSVPPPPPFPPSDQRAAETSSLPVPHQPREDPRRGSAEMTPWAPSPPVPAPDPNQPPPTAAAITSEQMMRRAAPAPDSGVRRMLFNVSKGRINLGPSGEDVRRRQLLALVRTRVNSCRRIAVISRKGGIGKTTTTLMLGHQFASVRGDRVVALDANPDAGSLADRVVRETESTVTDILRHGPNLVAYSDVRAYTSQAQSRLEIVATDNDPRISDALGEDEYARVMDVLARHYSLILCDTGTGILDSATRGILNMADQIVLCAAPSLDASRVSASTLDWLEQHGYGRLARDAVVAINAVRQGGPVELDVLQKFFERRCRAVVRIPWDARLSAGAETTLEELAPATRTAYLNLAAMVAAGFARS